MRTEEKIKQFTVEEIQKAKDFIWEQMNDLAKDVAIGYANYPNEKLEVKSVTIGFQYEPAPIIYDNKHPDHKEIRGLESDI